MMAAWWRTEIERYLVENNLGAQRVICAASEILPFESRKDKPACQLQVCLPGLALTPPEYGIIPDFMGDV
jgi:hypothetical protein